MKNLFIQNNETCATVDDDVCERLSKCKWYYSTTIYRTIYDGRRNISISLPSDIFNTKGIVYDHIDRNRFNNIRSNLRPCFSISENQANHAKKSGGTSKYKGVSLFRRDNLWAASIKINNKSFHLGRFTDEKDAAIAYNKAALETWGEFAWLNTI